MKKLIIAFILLSATPVQARSLEKIILQPEEKIEYTVPWWQHLIQIPLAYGFTVLWHETGHIVMYKAYGYRHIKLLPPNFKEGYVLAVESKYPYLGYKPGIFEHDLTSFGGMMFTSMMSISLTSMLRVNKVPKKLRSFIATTSLIMMFDRFRYVFTSALKYAFKKKMSPSDDVYSIMSNHFHSKKSLDIAYGVLSSVTVLEIALRWREIRDLIYIALGRKVTYKPNIIYVNATPAILGRGATFSISGNF
jgi:hypothetical protein